MKEEEIPKDTIMFKIIAHGGDTREEFDISKKYSRNTENAFLNSLEKCRLKLILGDMKDMGELN